MRHHYSHTPGRPILFGLFLCSRLAAVPSCSNRGLECKCLVIFPVDSIRRRNAITGPIFGKTVCPHAARWLALQCFIRGVFVWPTPQEDEGMGGNRNLITPSKTTSQDRVHRGTEVRPGGPILRSFSWRNGSFAILLALSILFLGYTLVSSVRPDGKATC
jgi:hypothetical protein